MTDTVQPDRGQLDIRNITHRFGSDAVLNNVSLELKAGEFVTFLGPSGCGKTTLLRIVAGFLTPSEGSVHLDGEDVTDVPPHKRWTNMVFQRPTLFPHLDVYRNIAFGLSVSGYGRSEIDQRVREALELVRLSGYERRRADELSGGQMQRVAMARAIVLRPKVLLLDEPLSALDLKIRLEMEVELRRLHRETGATFVYVTHDQREAMALSDRIVVFNEGHIEQVGSVQEIYRTPSTEFAARFVGNANVLPATIEGDTISVAGTRFPAPAGAGAGDAWLVIRPEAVRLAQSSGTALAGTVLDCAYRGTGWSMRIAVDGIEDPFKAEIATHELPQPPEVGTTVSLTWQPDSVRLLAR